MSLAKQLGLAFFAVLLIVFAGILFTSVENTRNFIERQLSSHAQDTATSLGLSITPYLANKDDLAIVDTMANAIFDRGYYSSIELVDLNNEQVLLKTNPSKHEKVPSWFSELFPITPPVAQSDLNDGWMQHGKLVVVSNPGIAYLQLWENALSAFWVVLVALIISQFFVWFLVKRIITQPIGQVIEQTVSIGQRNFEQISTIPKTLELSNIVTAVNYMAAKLSTLFKSLDEQSDTYKKFAYTDSLTNIGNRRAFELAITQILRNTEEAQQAYFGLVRASSLANVNNTCGPQEGDNYIKTVLDIISTLSNKSFDTKHLYRISGADFALVIENTSKQKVHDFASGLDTLFSQHNKSEYKSGIAHVGFTVFAQNHKLSTLLEQADSALKVAQNSDKTWQFADSLDIIQSNANWREDLQSILQKDHCEFAQQAVVDAKGESIYKECFARLSIDQNKQALPMGQLIPASVRLDYSVDLDRLIAKTLIQKIETINHSVGLNISRQSLFNDEFMQWFFTELEHLGNDASKLVLEIPERALIQDIHKIAQTSAQLKTLGVKIAIEHFGAQLAGLQHLQKTKPDFVKIDGRYTHNISQENDNQLFVKTLTSISHGLDIKVIAEMVELEADKIWLINNNVDYIQGFVIEKPSPK
ncbi:bifunctional diguanylate cyclase/phosphodiesterase [Glaciecola petra]|uniref:EAL domain-containing protein n=1 Tax=Glaciecola petra TaxID=3075602 RepID=A0ABU2ZWK7_9ALTE|nr:EAL domain-containing protein [Aestuariibacter sp. P117]MDT0595954.1 EAL domain-containing protein [Aestuariibacter sp. P117]